VSRTPSVRHPFRDLARAASWHRRKLAVVAAVAAVLIGISAARPPDPPSLDVVRATHEISAGTVVSFDDVRLDRVPRAAVPDAPLTGLDAVVGRTSTGAVAAGQVLTQLDLGTPHATRPGAVVAPLRLADAEIAGLLRVGDRVDVIAVGSSGGKAEVMARDVLVVGLPQPNANGGLAGGDASGPLVLVEVDLDTATALNGMAAGGRLGVVFR
jgi:pilus assembly protein CpaB